MDKYNVAGIIPAGFTFDNPNAGIGRDAIFDNSGDEFRPLQPKDIELMIDKIMEQAFSGPALVKPVRIMPLDFYEASMADDEGL